MKRSKVNFFTTDDNRIWIDKEDLLLLIKELGDKYQRKKQFSNRLLQELKKAKPVE